MDKQQQFVEDTGIYFERLGLMRMSGRIMGWLLICEPSHQSMGEIVMALQASKSAVSTALKQLQLFGMVERFTLHGNRREMFRLAYDVWQRAFEAKFKEFAAFTQLAEQGLAALEDAPSEQRLRLTLMRDMYAFMIREFPKLLAQWEVEKQKLGL